jgi:type IV secretory pathway TrbF-like protein
MDATLPASSPTKRPPPNPYVGTANAYNDSLASLLRENFILRVAGLLVLATALILFWRNQVLATRPPEIYGIVLGTQEHRVVEMPSIQTTDFRQAAVGYFLPLVIESLFSVSDVDSMKRNLGEFIRPFVADNSQAASFAHDWLQRHDPIERAQRERVQVQVDPIGQPRLANEYLVGWKETTRTLEGHVLSTKHTVADVTITWVDPTRDNLLGLKITSLTIDEQGDMTR